MELSALFLIGRASDQTITKNSSFLSNLSHGYTVMADRGFNIVEMLGSVGVNFKIPVFKKVKTNYLN